MSDCAERATNVPSVTHVDPLKRRRRLFAISLAFFACLFSVLLAWMDNSRQGAKSIEMGQELNGMSASEKEVGHVTNHVLQNLLAMVEEESGHRDASPVELAETQTTGAKKPCGKECLARKKIIAAKMKALRDEINHDFKAMTDFGHKAGYLPPPQSIKQQVMQGTLLGGGKSDTGANAVAPPPFDPSKVLSSKSRSGSDSGSSKTSLVSKSDSATSSLPSSDSQSTVDPPPPVPDSSGSSAISSDDSGTSSLDSSLNVDDSSLSQSSSDSSLSDMHADRGNSHSSHSSGDSAWAKAFSFIKKTDNPVVGSSNSRTQVHNHHSKDKDPLAAAENDKFLRGFEDPRTTGLSSTKHGKHDSLFDPTSPLKKGSDPLKSAESDKFLRGFLGA